ncbi:TetR family transcriptional regulator [Arthrobacter sp. STN4]|uniref:TetR family transcriptional regulator n=1 Tax=Arthrobacter sp. STN4 TaxID=2923276 RepID=UPI002119CBC0|nr:TetR family transcriptional regulator [Arthrobacter sp. STN4]MCQ9163388.1 TetR/AcrR family transcriptional regulator [Arthrobacter sp. STN4]
MTHSAAVPAQATVPAPTSRRELNKAATREAIAGATLAFLRAKSLSEFTVDDVAAAAGVSRRTFFNYFSSVEAAVASFTQNYLDTVIAELESRPADEPILESAGHALSAVDSAADLAMLAETFALTQDPQLGRFQLQAWEECSSKIADVARHRLPPATDELYIQALVGAVVGSCKAAFGVWFQEHGSDISPASLAHLRELLGTTISLVRNGFNN